MNKTKHIFIFETSDDWSPEKPYCWDGCPFSMNIKLDESCKYKTEHWLQCPFVRLGMIDKEVKNDI